VDQPFGYGPYQLLIEIPALFGALTSGRRGRHIGSTHAKQ
jgi:hypothetical protein